MDGGGCICAGECRNSLCTRERFHFRNTFSSVLDQTANCSKGWYKLSPFQAYSGIDGITSDGTKLNASIPNQQARQMDDDALSIMNNTSVMVPGEEGLKDILVVEAIYRSVAAKAKVKIS